MDSLVNAIVQVHNGETLVQPAITERILKGLSSFATPATEEFNRPNMQISRELERAEKSQQITLLFCSQGSKHIRHQRFIRIGN